MPTYNSPDVCRAMGSGGGPRARLTRLFLFIVPISWPHLQRRCIEKRFRPDSPKREAMANICMQARSSSSRKKKDGQPSALIRSPPGAAPVAGNFEPVSNILTFQHQAGQYVRPHRLRAGRTYATKYGQPRNKVRLPCHVVGVSLFCSLCAVPAEIGHMWMDGWGHLGQGRRDAC